MNFIALHLDELIRHHVNPKQEICSKMQLEAIAKALCTKNVFFIKIPGFLNSQMPHS